ncbi:N-acetylmuramoyl-L-alanine amidase [Allofournierella sp.]|uniref:N-acetylmuramoyl-L-alanine amidase n=1 Tax=Allofournierella sp. TaxID=1940256 RepID=UPI003AF0B1DF
MAYTNSSLVKYTSLSPNHSGQRTHSIDRITPHCVVGQLTAEGICACFPKGREASCNYGIGKDGKIALCVEEKNRSWCSSSAENDQRAVTIECASDSTAPYAFNTAVYNALIELCVDICKRNGKNKLLWLGDKTKTLNYAPKSGEMVLTVHRWFANKSCPGDWMYSRMGDLATTVTKRLSGVSGGGSTTTTPTGKTLYRVRKSWSDAKSQIGAFSVLANAKSLVDKNPSYKVFDESGKVVYEKGSTSTAFKPYTVRVTATDLYIRKGAGTNYSANGFIRPGVYTIVAESSGQGATKWGKLKSGAGWISLDYAKKL